MYKKQFPQIFTNTWIFIGFANEFKPKKIKSIQIMDRELILWKTQSGSISLMNAFCPHLGAHLANGKIQGELLECNFHKRRFNCAGESLGKGKNAISYPLVIINNMIFAWFGDGIPTWEMPDILQGFLSEDPTSKWKIFKFKKFNYNFHAKDLLDNTVDPVHFKTFHNQCDSYQLIEILDITPFSFISKATFIGNPKLTKRKIPFKLELVTESYGPANLIVNSTAIFPKQTYISKFIFLCTPRKGINTDYTLALATRIEPKKKLSRWRTILEYLYAYYAFRTQISEFCHESEKIWETKTFLTNPDYTAQEEAMKKYNNWYHKFFVN